MIFNTTFSDKGDKLTITDLIGDSYSFIEAIKVKGVGSKRMVIEDVSPGFKNILNSVADINYGNIEIRKKGILVHITKGLKNYSWAIPFYQMHIYKTSGYSIHAQGNFVRFKDNKLLKENKNFLDKLLDFKIENEKNYSFYDAIN
ncbi:MULTISPECIES: hypothetical protein [unclassified Polaribacter]|uniref:hypothetical protein n=1 Tax=unclassified Polaribacter TaxID=196858 RepID=UPI0011BF31F4|nr:MULTISPECIES: hypothetical protein [unclassified Polaribacter]TXD51237.1 hypothetical protein ES043_12885 [Polaribacter sp. IC063]TXD58235.1 hypothetical protein ES044_12825 [Polaribacter sp. IC066]